MVLSTMEESGSFIPIGTSFTSGCRAGLHGGMGYEVDSPLRLYSSPVPTDLQKAKAELRERVWKRIEKEKVGRFPGIRGRIPNFVGAEKAAERLEELDAWREARRIKCNPDSPQAPARKRALRAGQIVYMAVPRLREEACFLELDPARLRDLHQASSIRGAFEAGRKLRPEEMPSIDLVLCGSVAVARNGRRLGKGGGFSDLELALLMETKKLTARTPIVTTVHPVQIVEEIPAIEHDFRLDYIVTPEEIVRCSRRGRRPRGIYWDLLDPEKLAEIPPLEMLRNRRIAKKK